MNQLLTTIKTRAHGILRYSEKYFKTDMVYLVKGGSWLTFGQIVTAGTSFLLSVTFANLLPQSVYGTYRYITSLAATLTAFSLASIGTAVVQSVARGFEGVIRTGFWLSVKWSALLVGISCVGATYYFLHGNTVLAVSLLFIGSFSPFLNSANLATYYANGKKDFTRLSIYNIFKGVFPALVLIGTIFLTKNVIVIIFVYFLANTIAGLLTYRDVLKYYKPNHVDDPDLLDYSKKLSLLGVLSTITAQADKILVFTSLGSVELAIYSVATAFPEQIKALLRNLNFLMVPKFAEREITERNLNLGGKVFKLGVVILAITALYMVLAPFLFSIFFPKYAAGVLYSQLYGISMITALAMAPMSVLVAHKRKKELFLINTISSVVQLILLFVFIHLWGLLGVIISKIITAYVTMALSFILMKKHYDL